MKRLAVAALALGLVACGSDHHPVPEHGLVTDAHFTAAWMQMMPMPSCAGNPPICTTNFIPIFHPDRWDLEITDLNNPKWVGTVEVSHEVYDRCNLRELWPECSTENSGDVREANQ